MPLRALAAVVAVALGLGVVVGLALAGGDGKTAAADEAPLPGRLDKPKAVKVAGLDKAARIPKLVKVKTNRPTKPVVTATPVSRPTVVPTVVKPPVPTPQPTVDPNPSE